MQRVDNNFKMKNWALMSIDEKHAWLIAYGLHKEVYVDKDKFYDGNKREIKYASIDSNLIYDIENRLSGKSKDLYLENVLNEVSSKRESDTAKDFYSRMLFISKETKALCLYYTIKGQYV